MFISIRKYHKLKKENQLNNTKIYFLELENDVFKKALQESKHREKNLIKEIESLRNRLRHLLISNNVSQYDEHDRNTHTYKRHIRELDEEFSKYKSAYDILLRCTNCNTCQKAHKCEFVEWGDRVVYNCPHFESGGKNE